MAPTREINKIPEIRRVIREAKFYKMGRLKGLAHTLLMIFPVAAACLWTCWPALRAIHAASIYDSPSIGKVESLDPFGALQFRRSIQRHFSDHGVYVPIEDIQIVDPQDPREVMFSLARQNQCDRARLHAWIPLRFKWPIFGEKVVEWCWKLQAKVLS